MSSCSKFLAVPVFLALLGAAGWEAAAMDLRKLEEERDDVRGMVILRIPLGGQTSEGPRLGIDLGISKETDPRFEPNRFDPQTGQRMIEDDPESIRTWPINEIFPGLPGRDPKLPGPKLPEPESPEWSEAAS